jgi:hypothetical protein
MLLAQSPHTIEHIQPTPAQPHGSLPHAHHKRSFFRLSGQIKTDPNHCFFAFAPSNPAHILVPLHRLLIATSSNTRSIPNLWCSTFDITTRPKFRQVSGVNTPPSSIHSSRITTNIAPTSSYRFPPPSPPRVLLGFTPRHRQSPHQVHPPRLHHPCPSSISRIQSINPANLEHPPPTCTSPPHTNASTTRTSLTFQGATASPN